ncbi:MAG: GumC family protein [Anaerolineae bacterium]
MATADELDPRHAPVVATPEYYPPAYYYEDEIDLHSYVNILIKYWWLVVFVPLVAVIAAGIMGFLVMEPTYQATALVAVTSPRYIVQLSPNFETVPINQRQIPVKAYPALATSGDLLQRLLAKVGDTLPPEAQTLPSLRGMVAAKSGSDPTIIELTVTSTDPALATAVANAWADEFALMVQNVYGQSAGEVTHFEEQLAAADVRRTAAETAVIEFQARNPGPALEAQMQDQKDALATYLSNQRAIERVSQDAQNLRQRLSTQPAGARSTFGDDLSALLLEVNSLSSSLPVSTYASVAASGMPSASSGASLQVQVQAGSTLSDKTVGEQMAFLDALVQALQATAADLAGKADELQPQMLALQEQWERVDTEANRLVEERTIARDLFHSLSLKLEEARLDAESNGREVQVAARAVEPSAPSAPRKMMMVVVAAAVGLMVGVLAAFVLNFFRSNGKATRS